MKARIRSAVALIATGFAVSTTVSCISNVVVYKSSGVYAELERHTSKRGDLDAVLLAHSLTAVGSDILEFYVVPHNSRIEPDTDKPILAGIDLSGKTLDDYPSFNFNKDDQLSIIVGSGNVTEFHPRVLIRGIRALDSKLQYVAISSQVKNK